MLKISQIILKKRKEKNITQEELAEFMMVTKASVSKWETGQSYPEILLLPKLATFFNISLDELIGYEPQLSLEQIKRIYLDFENRVTKMNVEKIMEEVKDTAKQYYSCFNLLYYMSLFILNHCNLFEDASKRNLYLESTNIFLKRVIDLTEDINIKENSVNLRAACLISLGKSEEALDILPLTEMHSSSRNSLLATAYLQTKSEVECDKSLQIMIYNNVMDLITLMMMKSGLGEDNWLITSERVEDLIETFNLAEINVSTVLNFYLSVGIQYGKESNKYLSKKYVEKFLKLLINHKNGPFEIKGDKYFNKIDEWLNEHILMGLKPNRNNKVIVDSYLNILMNNENLKNVIESESTKELINELTK